MKTDDASPFTLVISNARVVMLWKVVEYTGLALFIIIVPRLMGPKLYGSFAVLFSLIGLLSMASGLGMQNTFGRFVPEYEALGDRSKTRALFTQIFCIRALFAGFLGLLAFLFFLPRLLPEATSLTLAVGTGGFLFGVLALTCYQLFFGLNLLGRWLIKDALIIPILIILLIALSERLNLERAAFALLVTQLGILLFGLFLARSFFTFDRSILNFSFIFSHLRFSLLFFAANLSLMVVFRGGEVIVKLFSGQSTEVAFFNIANSVAIACYGLIGQFIVMIRPSLTTLHVSKEEEKKVYLMGYTLKYLTIASFLLIFTVHILGVWGIERILGEQYLPVVNNLKVIIFGLIPVAIIRTGGSLAMLHKHAHKFIPVTVGALVIFILTAVFLVPRSGSHGASIAMVLALGSAAAITFYQFSLVKVLEVALFWRQIFVGIIPLGVIAWPTTLSVPIDLAAVVLYISLLFLGKVLDTNDIQKISKVVGFKNVFTTDSNNKIS